MVLPYYQEAEKAILHLLLDPRQPITQIMGRLEAEDFYNGGYNTLFKYMKELHEAGEIIDAIALAHMIEARKPTNLDVLILSNVMIRDETYMPVMKLCDLLRMYRWRRQALTTCELLMHNLQDLEKEVAPLLNEATIQLSNIMLEPEKDYTDLTTAAAMVMAVCEDNLNPDKRHECVKTGFRRIDDTGGLPPVGVTVVAADTGHGKSSLAVDLALENVHQGHKVAFFNLEMPTVDVARRIVAAETQIPFHQLAYGTLSDEQIERVRVAYRKVFESGGERFLFDQRMPNSLDDIITSIRRLADPKGSGVRHFYVDYLQILSWAGESNRSRWQNIEQALAYAARKFHNLSIQLDIQIVLTSQVNRDSSHNELSLDRIRDSKQIADAASCVLLLDRPEVYGEGYKSKEFRTVDPHGTALLSIAKRRNGPCLKMIVGFDAIRTSFYTLDQIPRVEERFTLFE